MGAKQLEIVKIWPKIRKYHIFEHFCVIKAKKLYFCCYWHSNELREEYDFILNGFSVKKTCFSGFKNF